MRLRLAPGHGAAPSFGPVCACRRTGARVRTVAATLVTVLSTALASPAARADDPQAVSPASRVVRPDAAAVPPTVPRTSTRDLPTDLRPDESAAAEMAPLDYTTRRYEPAGFPLIGGDSDIGFEFGVVGTLTHFGDGVAPYKWNMDLVLAASVKSAPHGSEIAQQHYSFNWDIVGAFGGNVRLNPSVLYQRTIDYGYFGIGNASSDRRPDGASGVPGRYFQYVQQEGRVRVLTRLATRGAWSPVLTAMYRFEDPQSYGGSKLASDAASSNADDSPVIRGLLPMSILTLGGGVIYDTRDNEFLPKRGQFHQVGVKFHEALPWGDDIRYGQAGAVFAGYIPLLKSVTLAARVMVDAQVGHVPFFELSTGGPFITSDMPGGGEAVRGVPLGRYYGKLKAVGNVELRTMLFHFTLLSQSFHIGNSLFFDTGRVWSDYTFANPRDGSGLGLKWGSGLGAIIQWGQAAVFRIDAAYSPDARSENPGFPIGLYVSDGVMF